MSKVSATKAMELELIAEAKLFELLSGSKASDTYAVGGVTVAGDNFYVNFCDTPHLARIHSSLDAEHPDNRLFRKMAPVQGYDDICYDQYGKRFLLLSSALKEPGQEGTRPKISELAADLLFLDQDWIDYPLEGNNRVLGGLGYLELGGQEYLFGLCRGNKCRGGRKGNKPGGGRIQVFQNEGSIWARQGSIKLPNAVQFENYTGIAARKDRIAVTSQANSALWVGKLKERGWGFVDDGEIYHFPKSARGNNVYCNLGGIVWLDDKRIVAVSGRHQRRQNKRCEKKDQSIHIFSLPGN